MPECFGGVNVSEPRDQLLIEQRRLDRSTPFRERAVQPLRRERHVRRLGSEPKLERRSGWMQIERAERARIIQHDARSVVEAEHRARKSRQVVGDVIEMPIAGHTEMGVQDPTVVEHDQLMLSAPFDPLYGRAAERPETRPRYAPAE